MWLCSVQGMTEADIREVNGLLKRQVEANLGMAMVYTLVDTLKDWLMNQVTICSCHPLCTLTPLW